MARLMLGVDCLRGGDYAAGGVVISLPAAAMRMAAGRARQQCARRASRGRPDALD